MIKKKRSVPYNAVTRLFVYLRPLHRMFRLLKFLNFNFIFTYVIQLRTKDWRIMFFRTVSINGNVKNNDCIFTCVAKSLSSFACFHWSGINMFGSNITFQLYTYIIKEKEGRKESEIPFLRYLYCLRSYTSPSFYICSSPLFLLNSKRRVHI